MNNRCLRCGKVKKLDESNYCTKCSKKVFKQGKHTTVEQENITKRIKIIVLTVIILVFTLFCLFCQETIFQVGKMVLEGEFDISKISLNISLPSVFNDLENTVLTSENYEKLSSEYAEKNKDSDKIYYYTYSVLYYTVKDGLQNLLSEDEEIVYKNIYGKTIKQLTDEGKLLMQENNITIDEYKNSLQNVK